MNSLSKLNRTNSDSDCFAKMTQWIRTGIWKKDKELKSEAKQTIKDLRAMQRAHISLFGFSPILTTQQQLLSQPRDTQELKNVNCGSS